MPQALAQSMAPRWPYFCIDENDRDDLEKSSTKREQPKVFQHLLVSASASAVALARDLLSRAPMVENRAKVWRIGLKRLVFTAAALSFATANAYTISNAAAVGCHERITSEALRAVRLEFATAAPLTATVDEAALIRDLQFTPDADMTDLGAATLLISVRDNDLKGRGSSDLTALPAIHGDPANQDEHCLRSSTQKEPSGTSDALTSCRAFIHGELAAALAGLDASGAVASSERTPIAVHLSIRGDVRPSLPTFYVHVGRAIHALQDSYSHSYRSADGTQVTTTLNWVDFAGAKGFVEAEDGPAHSSALDTCADADELRTRRRVLATAASTDLLRATLDPSKNVEQKLKAIDAVLDGSLSYLPGCGAANQWCSAPEAALPAASGCGCGAGAGASSFAGVLALLGLGWRSRRRDSNHPRNRLLPSHPQRGLFIAAAMVFALPAFAADDPNARPPPPVTPVAEPGPANPSATAFGGAVFVSGSIDRAAAAVSAGLRLRVSKHWAFGLDGEWNPWFAVNGTSFRTGVVNLYLSGILRIPLTYQAFNLRSTLSLGGSYLLSDFYGAPKGSTGVFFAIAPLGLEWKASRTFYVIFNPVNIAIPVPHLTGLPFLYPQYRLVLGLEFYAG